MILSNENDVQEFQTVSQFNCVECNVMANYYGVHSNYDISLFIIK